MKSVLRLGVLSRWGVVLSVALLNSASAQNSDAPDDASLRAGKHSEGVIVVPRAKAEEVANYARATLVQDKAARTRAYEQLGLPKDKTVD